jgi:hypothetical protein
VIQLFALQLGYIALALLHFHSLPVYPGLHFDEAWAMNYSWRIASEPGFWPLEAMSPYTAPWAHYWAALWLKAFSPSLFVFRASQAALSLGGILALHFSLPRASRFLLPWALLLLPGLILNHRFAIELTGLHALCLGLLCLGLSRRWWALALVAALVGSTGHILFYGVALGLLFALLTTARGTERLLLPGPRLALVSFFALISLFFLRVAFAIPEKGKGVALVLSSIAAAALLLMRAEGWAVWRSPWWGRVVPVAALVFLVNALFFGQGYWTSSIYTGLDVWGLYPRFAPPNFILCFLALFATLALALLQAPAFARAWLLASTTVIGLMMLKPAPRYYELPLLGIAALFVVAVAPALEAGWKEFFGQGRQRILRIGAALTLLLCAYTSLEMSANLLQVKFMLGARESAIRFLAFKDSSRDFLDKQALARFLGSSGCKLGDIETHDPRLLESLRALSLGDWPTLATPNGQCAYAYVARKTEEGASGEAFGEFFLKPRTTEPAKR